jgi:hypothetical protein
MTGANPTVLAGVTPVYSVDTQQRLASVHVVFFGQYGDVTELATQRGQSRQSLYRQAHGVARCLESTTYQQHIQQLQQEVDRLRHQVDSLRQLLAAAVVVVPDRLAEFASVSVAEGVSLPLIHRQLRILVKERTPSVAQLGRWSKDAACRASATLAVLDDNSRPLVKDAAVDELFVGRTPVLMSVELGSLAWVGGQLSASRDGATWAEQLRKLPALHFVSRDAGKGLDAGIAQINRERASQGQQPQDHAAGAAGHCDDGQGRQAQRPLDDQDDHFHLLREATRALRRQQGQISQAMDKAETLGRKRDKVARQGHNCAAWAREANRAWRKAEAAFQRWSAADEAWTRVRQEALPLFDPSGQLNTPHKAQAVLAQTLPALQGPEWAKVRRLLKRLGIFTFLDRVNRELAALPEALRVQSDSQQGASARGGLPDGGDLSAAEAASLVQAAVEVEGAKRHPQTGQGAGPSALGYRALVLVAGVMLAVAGPAGTLAQSLVRGVLRRAYRASSAVEGLNSIVRMHQRRHRRLTQGLLDLKRLNWNCRTFRTGKRKRQTPYGLLGLKLPTTDWWQLLKIPPEELRQQLSAQPLAS